MLKFTQVGQTEPMMLNEKDVLQILKAVSNPYVVITSKTGPTQYVVEETMSQLQVQVAPNLLIRVTQIGSLAEYMFYAPDIRQFTKWKNTAYTRLIFHSNKPPIVVTQTMAQIQVALSVSADNFISSIVYQDADPTPGPTTPNYPNLLSTYNNGSTRLTNLTGLFAALGAPFTLENTLFVSTNGDNATAVVGRLDKTWKNPWAAIAAAASGQAVIIFPGTYSASVGSLLKTGVKTYAYPGVLIINTNPDPGSDSPFLTDNTKSNCAFRGFADMTFAKTSGDFQIGGYVDGFLDIELNSLGVLGASVLFAEGARTTCKIQRLVQLSGTAAELIRIESTTTTGAVKQYQIDVKDAQFADCNNGIVAVNNVDVNAQVNIQNLRYTNLTTDLTSTDNTDCGASNININIENVFQTGSSQGGVVIDMKNFGNTVPTNKCNQIIRVKNVIAKLSAMRIGDCYDGLTEIELSGALQMTDTSIESVINNTNTGKCLIKADLLFNWAGATPPIAIFEFNGEGCLPNTHLSGNIQVIGKATGDASVFHLDGQSADHCRLKGLEVVTDADYWIGDTPSGVTATNVPITNSNSNKPSNLAIATVLNEVLDGMNVDTAYIQ